MPEKYNIKVLDSTQINCQSSYYCLSIILKNNLKKYRNFIICELKKKNIGSSIYYPQPVPRMSYYKKKYGYIKNNFVNSIDISDFSIALPVGPHLSKKNLTNIAKVLKKIIQLIK